MLLGSSPFDVREVYHLLVIVRTVCLVAGGLTHLYIGALFMNEDIRRYDAMRSLFRGAGGERLDRHLSAMSVAMSRMDRVAFNTHLTHAQDLVIGVGREAIHENTEWLTNHRTDLLSLWWPVEIPAIGAKRTENHKAAPDHVPFIFATHLPVNALKGLAKFLERQVQTAFVVSECFNTK